MAEELTAGSVRGYANWNTTLVPPTRGVGKGLSRSIITNIGRAPEPYNARRHVRTFSGRSNKCLWALRTYSGRQKKSFWTLKTFSGRANNCFWAPKHFPDAQTNVSGRPNIFWTRKQMFLDAQTLKPITKRDENHQKGTKRQKRSPVGQ